MAIPQQYVPFLNKLGRVKNKSNGGYMARCPAHEDRNPSLSVDFKDGTMLLLCFSGCSYESIMAAVGLTPADGFTPQEPTHVAQLREIVYAIMPGVEHIRREFSDGSKTFSWRRDGKDTLGGLKVTDLPLYGLDRIGKETAEGAGQVIIITEGEKDADSLWKRGWCAVATITGASTAPSVKVLYEALQGDTSIGRGVPHLWPDENDPPDKRGIIPGLWHMEHVARNTPAGLCPFIIQTDSTKRGAGAADFTGDIGELVGNALLWEKYVLWDDRKPAKGAQDGLSRYF